MRFILGCNCCHYPISQKEILAGSFSSETPARRTVRHPRRPALTTIWLRLDDIGRLDSALCSNKWRPPFLRLVSTKVLRFLREEIDVLDSTNLCSRKHKALLLPALAWILKRGIHLASLNLATTHSAIGVIKSLADEGTSWRI